MDYGWRPANDIETGMRAALESSDGQRYARLLRSATLYMPAPPDPGSPWPPSLPLPEGNHAIVFTSTAGLDGILGGVVDTYAETTVESLREARPADTQLVVNPGLPIGVFLGLGEVDDLAEGRQSLVGVEELQNAVVDEVLAEVRQLTLAELGGDADAASELEPANQLEERLRDAVSRMDFDEFLLALIDADVVLPVTEPVADLRRIERDDFPWRVLGDDESPIVPMFSSERVLDTIALGSPPRVAVSFLDVLVHWPSNDHVLCLNPGTSIELVLPGDSVPELVSALAEAAVDPGNGGPTAGA
ncbi:SseB family protein [Amycolatopsis taiwanensis]|uniref:SseB family protein n=1 Tax=Amycolatopsis taiwanensis TaxID=342230 RepID=UPI0004B9E634|nr:SseB family protein [Amycolatopsis taiwanensis]